MSLKSFIPPRWKRRAIKLVDNFGSYPQQIDAGLAEGLTIVAPYSRGRLYRSAAYEPAISKTLLNHLQTGMVVCDVGSHLGYHTLAMARLVGASGRVYAFEPLPKHVDTFARSLKRNSLVQVQQVPVAVGQFNGTAILDKWANDSMNNITQAEPAAGSLGTIPVTMVTLDEWAERSELLQLDCVKLDIEGQELAALQGGAAAIARYQPLIICEIHRAAHVPYRPWEVVEWLQEAGYSVVQIAEKPKSRAEMAAALDRLEKTNPPPGLMHVLRILAKPTINSQNRGVADGC